MKIIFLIYIYCTLVRGQTKSYLLGVIVHCVCCVTAYLTCNDIHIYLNFISIVISKYIYFINWLK